ncbi:MAG: hypothetical protein R3B97_06315 [Dehalococcoidia bacterium]|nr:hypothetical protein [Dehalococcoidia bacterium]MCA9829190.1 hypothetical protein [Dehalococcoidia bacterium]MCB9486393.1 hypothetical protein [Thermoflexaceae bacterium]
MSGVNGGRTSGLRTLLTRLTSPGYVLIAPFLVIAVLTFVLDLSLPERFLLVAILAAIVVAVRYFYQPWWLRKYGRRR